MAVDDDDSETLSEVPVTTDGPAKIKLNTSYIEVTVLDPSKEDFYLVGAVITIY